MKFFAKKWLKKLENKSHTFKDLPKRLQKDYDFLLNLIAKDYSILKSFPKELKADKNFMQRAVSQNIHALNYAAEKLKSDREVILVAANKFSLENLFCDKESIFGFFTNINLDFFRNKEDVDNLTKEFEKSSVRYIEKETTSRKLNGFSFDSDLLSKRLDFFTQSVSFYIEQNLNIIEVEGNKINNEVSPTNSNFEQVKNSNSKINRKRITPIITRKEKSDGFGK